MNSVSTVSGKRNSVSRVATIAGLGTAVPPLSISQEDACEHAQAIGITDRYARALPKLYQQSGVGRRHSVLLTREDGPVLDRMPFYPVIDPGSLTLRIEPDEEQPRVPTTADRMDAYRQHAPGLARIACQRAIENSNLSVSEITHLITVSCTGFCAPGIDIALMESLPLARSVERTHVGFMGCHGSLNGMRVARAICESQPQACVLMVSVELCSLHQQYTNDPQQLVANSLFGDGAAAMILKSRPRRSPVNVENETRSETEDVIARVASSISLSASASTVLPDTQSMMSWQVGNYGFEMGLSAQVPNLIESELPVWISNWLAESGLTTGDISKWIVHPGGPRILTATANALGLTNADLAPSWKILHDYGNMSSPTVLFILQQILQSNATGPMVMLGFGPGLCVEACLLVCSPGMPKTP